MVFRADAAFARPEIHDALEQRGVEHAIRIPANENLERDIAELLTRPVGRPRHNPVVRYKSFPYQTAGWNTARRVVAKVEFHYGKLVAAVGTAAARRPQVVDECATTVGQERRTADQARTI